MQFSPMVDVGDCSPGCMIPVNHVSRHILNVIWKPFLNERIEHADSFPSLWAGFTDFIQFFLFFSPAAFVTTVERAPLVERARTGSGHYRVGVGDGLKQRVFEALRLSTEGFLAYQPNHLDPNVDLETCRFNSLVFLYRLLFVLYAEDRKLLPYGVDRAYTENRSLGRFRNEIAVRLDRIREKREPGGCVSQFKTPPTLPSIPISSAEDACVYPARTLSGD